jgi:hypothetical protein
LRGNNQRPPLTKQTTARGLRGSRASAELV